MSKAVKGNVLTIDLSKWKRTVVSMPVPDVSKMVVRPHPMPPPPDVSKMKTTVTKLPAPDVSKMVVTPSPMAPPPDVSKMKLTVTTIPMDKQLFEAMRELDRKNGL